MSVALIIERISACIAAGELPKKTDNVLLAELKMADLLRPWDEVFPGMRTDAGDHRNMSSHRGKIRRPKFSPQVRKSRRPLQRPRMPYAPCRLISPTLFTSLQAIKTWYGQQDIDVSDIFDGELNEKGLDDFLHPLYVRSSDYWPLSDPLENLCFEDGIFDLNYIYLRLPHWHYDEECAGAAEGMLSGADGVEWLMQHYYSIDGFVDLPEEDHQIIKLHGFDNLAACYEQDRPGRTYNLKKLKDHQNVYFSEVWKDYENGEINPPIITADGMDVEIEIFRPEDIDFCLAYSEAFCQMVGDMPDVGLMEDNIDRTTDKFMHELCEVWRTEHDMPSVDGPLLKNAPWTEIFNESTWRDQP